MADWRNPQDYDFTQGLTAPQWAWEFLRRNPVYRLAWQQFIDIWRALEADYGKPAHRDVAAWQRDPRAWVAAADCRESDCRIEGDRVLIECALGAHWGFYKFPPDPADDEAVAGGRLVWREVTTEIEQVEAGETTPVEAGKVCLGFDLSLPLTPQLEQAKRRLQIEQRRLIVEGVVLPPRIEAHAEILAGYLRRLDGQAAGATLENIAQVMGESPAECERHLQAALALRDGKYPRLLRLH